MAERISAIVRQQIHRLDFGAVAGFLFTESIRHMVSQPENRLDFADIMDSGKIFLAKLPEGLGKENSSLLGTLLISKFQQIAMARQARRSRRAGIFGFT